MELLIEKRIAAGNARPVSFQECRQCDDVFVFGIPRGCVPVATDITTSLDAGID